MAIARFERAVGASGVHPGKLPQRTLSELASAIAALQHGETPELEDVGALLVPGIQAPRATETWSDETGPSDDEDDEKPTTRDIEQDDVLEIVEERVDDRPRRATCPHPPRGPRRASGLRAGPRRPATRRRRSGDAELEGWAARIAGARGLVAEQRGLLGLRLPPLPATVPGVATPPDERLVGLFSSSSSRSGQSDEDGPRDVTERVPVGLIMSLEALSLAGSPFDALFPAVRGALRAIVAAAEGRARATRRLLRPEICRRSCCALGPSRASSAAIPRGRWARSRAAP